MDAVIGAGSFRTSIPCLSSDVDAGGLGTSIASAATGTIALAPGLYFVSVCSGTGSANNICSLGIRDGTVVYAAPTANQPGFDTIVLCAFSASAPQCCLIEARVTSTLMYNNYGPSNIQLNIQRLGDAP